MKRIYVNPLPVRIWHWTNAAGFVLLILTGLQIRYLGAVRLLSFRTAVQLHNWIGFVLMANFLIWLGFYLFTDKIRVYHPELSPRKHFLATFRQMRYYGYGIFRGEANPHHINPYAKFNALQSVMYQLVMIILVPIQFGTGLLLWDVTRFARQVEFLGGLRVVDTVHVLLFIFLTAFILVHPYLASLSAKPFAHFKAMVSGYEEVEDEPGTPGPG